MESCKNCGHNNIENYCAKCGMLNVVPPYTLRNVSTWVDDMIDFNKGYLITIIHLIINPFLVITTFTSGVMKKYSNPAKTFILTFSIIQIIMLLYNVLERDRYQYFLESGIVEFDDETSDFTEFYAQLEYGFTLISLSIIYAIFNFNVFKSLSYSFLEHIIISLYNCSILLLVSYFYLDIANLLYPYVSIPIGAWSIIVLLILVVLYYMYFINRVFKSSIFKSIIIGLSLHIPLILLYGFLTTFLN